MPTHSHPISSQYSKEIAAYIDTQRAYLHCDSPNGEVHSQGRGIPFSITSKSESSLSHFHPLPSPDNSPYDAKAVRNDSPLKNGEVAMTGDTHCRMYQTAVGRAYCPKCSRDCTQSKSNTNRRKE